MSNALILANDRDVQLVKRTVAQDLTQAELDLFIHMARQWRLDPLRRQLYAIVYSKDNPKKRRVSYITGIDGYRTLADRTGNYRPGQRTVEQSDATKNPMTNPQGIVSATAGVWKHVHGDWHEFSETVYWDEYAPIKDEWDNGQRTGRRILDQSGQWARMGRTLLQKCAEAQALRRGWPDEYGDLYVAEEMDQAKVIDITPSEQAERADVESKLALMGGKNALTVMWDDGAKLERVPEGQFIDRALKWSSQNTVTATEVRIWWNRNEPARAEFKARHGSDYLAFQKAVEKLTNDKERAEANQEAAAE